MPSLLRALSPFALAALTVLAACGDQQPVQPDAVAALAPYYPAGGGRGVAGQYIVVMQEGRDAGAVMRLAGVRPRHRYAGAMEGFAGRLNPAQLHAVRRAPGVAFVEQDSYGSIMARDTHPVVDRGLWGLDRIDQHERPMDGTFTAANTGAGVHVYVMDTGLEYTHPEFGDGNGGSRAVPAWDYLGGDGADCHGHGTHVAGTVGGGAVGVAPAVTLHSVRVTNCSGYYVASDLAKALEWVRANRIRPAVANISLVGPYSKAVNFSLDRMAAAYVLPVVAAGNSAGRACDASPASAVQAYTVAATDSMDQRASFSNWGRCVMIYAPGVDVLSSYLGGAYGFMSGTSMAAPHVTGVAALYLQQFPTAKSTSVAGWLSTYATANRVGGNDTGSVMYGTPNRLLFKGTL